MLALTSAPLDLNAKRGRAIIAAMLTFLSSHSLNVRNFELVFPKYPLGRIKAILPPVFLQSRTHASAKRIPSSCLLSNSPILSWPSSTLIECPRSNLERTSDLHSTIFAPKGGLHITTSNLPEISDIEISESICLIFDLPSPFKTMFNTATWTAFELLSNPNTESA